MISIFQTDQCYKHVCDIFSEHLNTYAVNYSINLSLSTSWRRMGDQDYSSTYS